MRTPLTLPVTRRGPGAAGSVGRLFCLGLAASLLALGCGGDTEDSSTHGRRTKVLAFYYAWYHTPEISGFWSHWVDPETPADADPQEIYSAYLPLHGLYDSTDEAVIARHLEEAAYAGIDALIISWWGIDSRSDHAARKIFDVAERIGSPVTLTLYYEFVPQGDPAQGIRDIEHLYANYLTRPQAFRHRGQPVLFVYGRAIFPSLWCLNGEDCTKIDIVDWKTILASVRKSTDIISNADCLLPPLVSHLIELGFDGFHYYNMALFHRRESSPRGLEDLMSDFRKEVGDRTPLVMTVIPGYDDLNQATLGRKMVFSIGRDGGEYYRRYWRSALSHDPDWVLITSFNEWHEGTQLEPARSYGDFYLDLTRELTEALP